MLIYVNWKGLSTLIDMRTSKISLFRLKPEMTVLAKEKSW